MFVIRLLLAVVLLGGAVAGQTVPATKPVEGERASQRTYTEIDLVDFNQNPEQYDGRRVALTAEVISISANSGSLHLFAAPSRALIEVSLGQLRKSERRAIVQDPVLHVAVYGRVSRQQGRIVVEAERVEPVMTSLVSGD